MEGREEEATEHPGVWLERVRVGMCIWVCVCALAL